MSIHPTAIISPKAELGRNVSVGPYSTIGDGVILHDEVRIISHTVIEGPAEFGRGCIFYPFVSAGLAPPDLKYKGEPSLLQVGERNTFREYVTLHRGTEGGGGMTRIGSDNLFMPQAHVAHDSNIGNHTIFANAATLAGHVLVEDYAIIGAYSGIHQFCRVGRYAFIGGYSVVVKDALPFARTVGNHAKCYGENTLGLRRRGFDSETLRRLHRAFRLLLSSKLNTTQAVAAIKQELSGYSEIDYLVAFIESAQRGVTK